MEARPPAEKETIYATHYLSGYKCVNFKRGDDEYVSVYLGDTLIQEYKQRRCATELQHKCNYTMFSETHWFFLNPFHTLVECCSPAKGYRYHKLAQGQVTEVRGCEFKDASGWDNGVANTMAGRMNSDWRGHE